MRSFNKKIKSKEKKKLSGLELKFIKLQFGRKSRSRLYRKLGTFLENSVPLIQALEIVRVHSSNDGKNDKKAMVIIIDDIILNIRNGLTFSQALSRWVSGEEVSILNAGEISGTLHLAIQELLFLFNANKLIKKAKLGLLYPLALLLSTVFYLYIFSSEVVPAFENVLPREKWTGKGKILGDIADIVMGYLQPVTLGVFILTVLYLATLPYWTGKIRLKLDNFVPWSLYKTVKGCGFMISFSALSKAGIPSPEVLSILSRYANPWSMEKIRATRSQLLNGAPNIGEALYLTKLNFPDEATIIDMRSYSSLSGANEMLEIMSKEVLNTTVEKIQNQVTVIKNLAIVLMGFTLMFIIAAMFDLQQLISSSAF